MPNALSREKSPYLLQHAGNPVDWFPWGEAAFEKARREDKPVLVSIGYSTCHWCHVMERESFSNPEIAGLMNEHLVNVKVDREERPDVDQVYMTAVMAMTGQGGWPLNVFLTPDRKPFFGGTYFPPEDLWGRPGWANIVRRIGALWRNPEERRTLEAHAGELVGHLQSYLAGSPERGTPDFLLLQKCFRSLQEDFDPDHGGFGGAPKFPMPVNLNFLLRYATLTPRPEESESARKMVFETLRALARGGIYDPLGGGFSRYSTDEEWRLPHFEKMLYDNAQLAVCFLEAFQVCGDPEFEAVARETLDYLLRDMKNPSGGFCSAEDADSIPPDAVSPSHGHASKREGAFYLWSRKEILSVLGNETGELFCRRYGVEETGNIASDPHGEFAEKNILFVARTIEALAQESRRSPEELRAVLHLARGKLFSLRSQRPRPDRDDKVITGWNGLALSAFAKGYQVLGDERYLESALETADFIKRHCTDAGRLYRRWRDGERQGAGVVDDYAFWIQGLLDVYESCWKTGFLEWSLELARQALRLFQDPESGGFYFADPTTSDLPFRVRQDQDNVEPAAGSVMVHNLLRLHQWTGDAALKESAQKILECSAPGMASQPRAFPQMLAALGFALAGASQIVLAGSLDSPRVGAFLKEIYRRFLPWKVLVWFDPAAVPPVLEGFAPLGRRALSEPEGLAFVCAHFSCQEPASDSAALAAQLDRLQNQPISE